MLLVTSAQHQRSKGEGHYDLACHGIGVGDKADQIRDSLSPMVTGFPWLAGREGARQVRGTPLEQYDDGPAELRDEELLLAAVGQDFKGSDKIVQTTMPPRRFSATAEPSPAVKNKDE
jgi:hypothetical protein